MTVHHGTRIRFPYMKMGFGQIVRTPRLTYEYNSFQTYHMPFGRNKFYGL